MSSLKRLIMKKQKTPCSNWRQGIYYIKKPHNKIGWDHGAELQLNSMISHAA